MAHVAAVRLRRAPPAKTQPPLPRLTIESPSGALQPGAATDLVRRYLENIQVAALPAGGDAGDWVQLKRAAGLWEHAKWLDGASLERELGREVLLRLFAPELVDAPPADRVRAVLRRRGPFVALVDEQRALTGLVDRGDLLELVAGRIAADAA